MLAWLKRSAGQPHGLDGRRRRLPVIDGGIGVLESAEKAPGLCTVSAGGLGDLLDQYNRFYRAALPPRHPPRWRSDIDDPLPPDKPDYRSTILK